MSKADSLRAHAAEKPLEPDPVIEAYKRDIDRTLLRESLKLTVEQRFENLMELQRFAEELRKAGRQAFHD
jgi:hypothetical protein